MSLLPGIYPSSWTAFCNSGFPHLPGPQGIALLLRFAPSFRDLSHQAFKPFCQSGSPVGDNSAQCWRSDLKFHSRGESYMLAKTCPSAHTSVTAQQETLHTGLKDSLICCPFSHWPVERDCYNAMYMWHNMLEEVHHHTQHELLTSHWAYRVLCASLACTHPKSCIARLLNHLSLFQHKMVFQWYWVLPTKSQASKLSLVRQAWVQVHTSAQRRIVQFFQQMYYTTFPEMVFLKG